MTYDVEHLFICLLAIHVSSLVRYLLRYLAYFSVRLFIFLLLSFKSSLYILDDSPLSGLCFANISPSLWLVFSFSWQLFFLNTLKILFCGLLDLTVAVEKPVDGLIAILLSVISLFLFYYLLFLCTVFLNFITVCCFIFIYPAWNLLSLLDLRFGVLSIILEKFSAISCLNNVFLHPL